MKIALLQINPTVGDLAGNARLIADAVREAGARGADLAVTPELALVGYLPRDLLLERRLRRAQLGRARTRSRASSAGLPPALVGLPEPNPSDEGRPLFNSAALLRGGARRAALSQGAPAHLRRLRRGPLLRAVSRTADAGARRPPPRHQHLRGRLERSRLLEAAPLSPRSDRGARARRRRRHRQPVGVAVHGRASTCSAKRCSAAWRASIGVPLVYVNQFGGNDDLVFDGRSCAFGADGAAIARGRSFDGDVVICDIDRAVADRAAGRMSSIESEIWRALVLGTRDYARKCGFSQRGPRAVGRDRFRADRGDRRRSARRRSRPGRADAVAVLEPRQPVDDSRSSPPTSASRRSRCRSSRR